MDSLSVINLKYQWVLENVEKDPKTLSSKMILFRGEKVFRVALKNTIERQTLIFVAINFNKIGMKVREVFYSNENLDNSMELTVGRNEETMQIFSVVLGERVCEKTIFNLEIHIEGNVPNFSYQLADRLLKKELWKAVQKLPECGWTDIDLIVQGKKIAAHKCILAARSPVFAAEFAKDAKVNQTVIDDVDFSTVEQFLHFLYTGETDKSLANEQLLKLAKRYQLTTLIALCNNALKEINAEQVTLSLIELNPKKDPMTSFETRPMKDTELYFDPNTSTFLVEWKFIYNNPEKMGPDFFNYENEKLFSAQYVGLPVRNGNSIYLELPMLRLIFTKLKKKNYQVIEVHVKQQYSKQWTKMEERNVQKKGLISVFSTSSAKELYFNTLYSIKFRIKMKSTIENHYYEMMDTTCATQLGTAASNGQMTDVEISVGSKKFVAHRVVLAARSRVFEAQLNKNRNIAKSSISVDNTIGSTIFLHFLEFLYTGTLKISACNKQLLALAEMYEVETLKKLCQTVNYEVDVEDVTTSMIAG